jgi:hypothetical protein
VSVKAPIWSWGLPLNAFEKLPVMVTQSSRLLPLVCASIQRLTLASLLPCHTGAYTNAQDKNSCNRETRRFEELARGVTQM